MNVLLMDDQQIIFDGMQKGVGWKKIGIENFYYAKDIATAKKMTEKYKIQIALCDIEMPGENGLDFIVWSTVHYPDLINILLTSHMEFEYAQRAIKMGVFDYIVQPASYEEIERVVKKAVEKVKLQNRQERAEEYLKFAQTKKKLLSETVVYDLIYNEKYDSKKAFCELAALGYHCEEKDCYTPTLVQIFENRLKQGWTEDECQWTVENILQELAENCKKEALIYSNAWDSYYVLIADKSTECDMKILEYLEHELEKHLHSGIAIYKGKAGTIKAAGAEFGKLEVLRKNNVMQRGGIWFKDNAGDAEQCTIELSRKVLEGWRRELEHGMIGIVREEVTRYIEQIQSTSQINFQTMLEFHQKFTQLFLHILAIKNIDISTVFDECYTYTDYQNGYQTINELKKAVDKVFTILMKVTVVQDKELSYTERAQQYILERIQTNIRVYDIAESIGISVDYLSKMFKKDTGTAIKDYIAEIKVEKAKQLLASTGKTVSEVAWDTGYDSVSNFIQVFKKYTNMTPSEYKKEANK